MPRPRIKQGIVDRIEDIWASDTNQTAKEVFAKADKEGLIRWIRGPEGNPTPSMRKVEEIVHNAKEKAKRAGPLPLEVELTPWCDGLPWDEPEANVFLFRLLYISNRSRELGPVLTKLTVRKAKWVLKLRHHYLKDINDSLIETISSESNMKKDDTALSQMSVQELQDYARALKENIKLGELYYRAFVYAERERKAEVLGKPKAYTADLDAQLMYRVWEHEERRLEYQGAVDKGIIPAMEPINFYLDSLEVLKPGFKENIYPLMLNEARAQLLRLDSRDSSTEEREAAESTRSMAVEVIQLLEKLIQPSEEGVKRPQREEPSNEMNTETAK